MNLAIAAIVALLAPGFQDAPKYAAADLDLARFVAAPDPSFSWTLNGDAEPGQNGIKRRWAIRLTSQTWQGGAWEHALQVYEPEDLKYPDVMLLYITGGNNTNLADRPRFPDAATGQALAKACRARVAILPQVPNQPLMGGKVEDDLIAETFTRYLATKDATLPLLQPMVKSAVKGMDALGAFCKAEGMTAPRFVVTGASKRGWTTWLTGAIDPRVIAIAPMVIPTLNMKAQKQHQLDTWGKYSEQIDDYTRRALLADFDQPDRQALWKLIDPFTYRDRLTMPKLQINGTNDPYWTLDSMNLYWDDLKGPKYVVYLPNAVHNLQEHRDWAVNGVGALFRHAASGRELPKFSWDMRKPADCDVGMVLALDGTTPAPTSVRFWTARSDTKDFRKSRWTASEPIVGPYVGVVRCEQKLAGPAGGYGAIFADLTFEVDGLAYHLSSQIAIFGLEEEKP